MCEIPDKNQFLFFCGNILQVFIETYKGIGWCLREFLLWVLRSLSELFHPIPILGITANSHSLIWSYTPMWSPPGCSGSTSLLQEPCCSSFGCLFPFQKELSPCPPATLYAGSCPSPSQQTASLNERLHERGLDTVYSAVKSWRTQLTPWNPGLFPGQESAPCSGSAALDAKAAPAFNINTQLLSSPSHPTPLSWCRVSESECEHRHSGTFCFPKAHMTKLLSARASSAPPQQPEPGWAHGRCSG